MTSLAWDVTAGEHAVNRECSWCRLGGDESCSAGGRVSWFSVYRIEPAADA